jgi:twinkle protein
VRCTKTEYVFRGFDEHGKIAYAQYIKRVGDEKGVRFSDKAKLCLWGMHSMKELNVGGSVIITEGVIDAMTFRSADMFAVSIPSGIKNTNWIQLSWDWLSQFETIYLAFDWDEAAQEIIVEIAGRLGIYRCKKVVIPEKDANETQLQHTDTWTQLLKKYIDEAKDFMPPARITAREAKSRVETYMSQGEIMNTGQLLLGWEFAPTETKRHPLNFRFRSGEQTIWSGYTGSGKSSVLFQHIAYAIFVQGETVALAALEEQFEKVITTIIKIALGKFPKIGSREYEAAYEILADKLIIHNVLGIEKLSNVLEFFEYASKKDGARHCILDSIMCTDVDVDSDKATVNNMMKTIIESLARSGSHYHIVAHCTKGNDEDYKEIPRVNTVKGIQEITARAHNVIFVWRNKPKEASIEGSIHKSQPEEARRKEREMPDTIIKVAKNRNGKVLGQIKAWFSFYSDRFRPEYEGTSDRPYFVCEDSSPD